jgi:hypothetical protein
MSAVAGIKKVKKVTKTTTSSKKLDGGETITETTSSLSRESTSASLGEAEREAPALK